MSYFRQEVLDSPAYHIVDENPGIKLDQNESPFDLPVELKAAAIETLLKISWNRYPLGDLLLLRKKMAKYMGVWPDNLLFANGSNVLIQALITATSVGGKVVTVDPTFSLYELEAKLLGNKVIAVNLNEDFSLPIDLLLKTIKRNKPNLVILPNPNAPTGNSFDPDMLKKIISSSGCLVAIDEAYYPFSQSTIIESIRDYDNLVVLRTFSKAFGLAGLRLGLLAGDPEVVTQIQKCLLPFCVSKITLAIILTILDHPEYVDEFVKNTISERDRIFEELSKIEKIKAYPSQANYILFEVENPDDVFKNLVAQKITIRRIKDDRRLVNTLRLSIGTKEENDEFLKAINQALS